MASTSLLTIRRRPTARRKGPLLLCGAALLGCGGGQVVRPGGGGDGVRVGDPASHGDLDHAADTDTDTDTAGDSTPINTPPECRDDSVATRLDRSVRVNVLANDIDADDDLLQVTAVAGGTLGSPRLNGDGSVDYLPHPDFEGSDSFHYTVSDGTASASATVTVTESGSAVWLAVPLRSAAEKAAGRAGGEAGQMAQTLAISTADPDRIAVGIDTAATYVSEDAGFNWQLRRNGINSNGVQSVAFDPANPDVLWAAGYRSVAGTVRSYPPSASYVEPLSDGIYRSADLGRSWTRAYAAVFLRGQAQNQYFAFDPTGATTAGSQIIYAATHDAGLLRSIDSGTNWLDVGPRGAIYNAILRQPQNGDLWLAADEGLWLSIDDALSWSPVTVPALPVKGIALHPTDPTSLWIALDTAGIWHSADSGQSWQLQNATAKQWTRMAVSPVSPHTLYADANKAGGPYPQYSHDGGTTWKGPSAYEASFIGNTHYHAEGLITHPSDPLVAYTFGPARRTIDGGLTWQIIGNGVSGMRRGHGLRSSIAFRPEDPAKIVLFHTDHGAARTSDGGDTWTYIPAPRQADLGAKTQPGGAYDPSPGSQRMVSAVGGWNAQRLCRTEDDGDTWTVFDTMVDDYRFFAWHAQDTEVVYVGTKTAGLRSVDKGLTWTPVSRPLRAVFPANNDVLFAVTLVATAQSQVERSDDRGDSWTPVGAVIACTIKDVDVDPIDSRRLYAVCHNTNGGLRVYDGISWSARGDTDGLERDFFGRLIYETLAVDPRHSNVIYAGQRDWSGPARGLTRSIDSGATWSTINWNLPPDLAIWGVVVSPHDSTVWVATDYGNWKMTPGGE